LIPINLFFFVTLTFFRVIDDGGRFDDRGLGLLKPPSLSVVPIASRLLISA
jgi:hypothetical protein